MNASGRAAGRGRRYRRGLSAERIAAWRLRLAGYRILAQRLKTPVGEIDLVARRGDRVAFVEVKARATLADALESVTPRQRQRIERAAAHFLAHRPALADCEIRFDVIAVVPGRPPRHLKNAWCSGG